MCFVFREIGGIVVIKGFVMLRLVLRVKKFLWLVKIFKIKIICGSCGCVRRGEDVFFYCLDKLIM